MIYSSLRSIENALNYKNSVLADDIAYLEMSLKNTNKLKLALGMSTNEDSCQDWEKLTATDPFFDPNKNIWRVFCTRTRNKETFLKDNDEEGLFDVVFSRDVKTHAWDYKLEVVSSENCLPRNALEKLSGSIITHPSDDHAYYYGKVEKREDVLSIFQNPNIKGLGISRT